MSHPARTSACFFLVAAMFLAVPVAHAAWPAVQWQSTLASGDAASNVAPPVVAVDSAGNILTGATQLVGATECAFVTKLAAATGAVVWRQDLCDHSGTIRSIAVDHAGHVLLGGSAFTTAANPNAWLFKLDGGTGRLHWERFIDLGSGTQAEVALDIGVDAQDQVYVATSWPSGGVSRLLKYSDGGTLRWQSEAAVDVTAVRLDSAGVPYVTASFAAPSTWVVMRLNPGPGETTWRSVMPDAAGAVPLALAVDGAGNVIATGSLMTVKYDGLNGSVVWRRAFDVASAIGRRVAVDGRGDVFVAGVSGTTTQTRETVKLRGEDGAIVWRASKAASGGLPDAMGLVVDPFGNPIVAGPDDRTTALKGDTGAEIWAIPLEAVASIVAAGDGIVVAGVGRAASGPDVVLIAKYGFAAVPAINTQGLWWRSPPGSESGWGINLVHQGDILFATWFTYDAQRRPLWLVMSEGVRTGTSTYTGTVYETSGPPFNSATWDPALVDRRAVGTATFTFANADNGTFRFAPTLGAVVTDPITRQVFATPVPACTFEETPSATNFQDLWWAAPPGSESGWGLNIAHQGNVIFATWFTYGTNGLSTWFVASDMRRAADGAFTGELYRTSGPSFAADPWDPNLVTRTAVGSATLAFTGASTGRFSYTVDGVSGSKPITRQVFATPQTVCR